MATAIVDGRIVQAGRAKAYRPLAAPVRRRALAAGVEAYARGDFFEAHELLEPAWMGTRELADREALQGLIKLAAAYVHAVRGNPAGVGKNLAGAAACLRRSVEAAPGPSIGLDVAALDAAIAARVATLAAVSGRGPSAWPADRRSAAVALLAAVPPPPLRFDR